MTGHISPFQGWQMLKRHSQGFTLGYFMLPRWGKEFV